MASILKSAGHAARKLQQLPAIAWAVLLASLALTAVAWSVSDRFVHQIAQDRFISRSEDVKDSIIRRMADYEVILRGGVALFAAPESVERADWQAYADNLHIARDFPGVQGFGFSQVVLPAERARHEQQIRGEGFPEYTIRPAGERELYTAIIYLEPFNVINQRAFGYDMYSEATRRAAMERAADSGRPALSGRVKLMQETATNVQHGVLMYLPVYGHQLPLETVQQRRAALQGFVYAPFRMDDLMHGILGAEQRDIEFELYDGAQPSAQNVLYQGHASGLNALERSLATTFDNLSQIEIAGRSWSIYLHASPGFLSAAEKNQPLLVAVGGSVVSLLLFFIFVSMANQKKRAEALAREMTVDLRRSNADLEQFAYAASHDLRQPLRMISSYLQLLEMELAPLLNEETKQNLYFATEGAQRMDQMLTALLEYSRVGRNSDAMTLVESRQMLDEALHYLQPAIAEAQAEVRIQGVWPAIVGRRDEMVRLFQNLVGNALKYRIAGRRPEILVVAEAGVNAGSEHRFSIRDNGVGLLAGQEARLFKLFERLQPRGKYPGTGIGLALCRKIVELHGGRIGVESPGENRGCSFIFTLPAATDRSPALITQNAQRL
ncbi:CHASE domain-containing protein [Propionivibrio sp.]|uniref:CHASE domain-containing protein n=1 Tax=Propionivibrio sp. TaxID=2212460 RepID=UPI003BF1FB55